MRCPLESAHGAERLNEPGNERLLLGLRIGDPDNEVAGPNQLVQVIKFLRAGHTPQTLGFVFLVNLSKPNLEGETIKTKIAHTIVEAERINPI